MAYRARLNQLVENNKAFAQNWKNPTTMEQLRADVKPIGGGMLIVTCLDPRCVPEAYFGPDLRAGVIRNAGGRTTEDVIRSILAIRALTNVQAVVVVHHTDCGMTHLTDAGIAADAKNRNPSEAVVREIDAIEKTELSFGCFTPEEYEQTIKDDVLALRKVEALRGVDILGMSLDLDSGLVSDVQI